jgi:hypothetical protein
MNTTPYSGRYPVAFRALQIVGAAVLLANVAGCGRKVIVQAPPATVIQTTAPAPAAPLAASTHEIVVVRDAPPPPRSETMSARPSEQHVWVPGYWAAGHDGQQVWVSGHWEVPPSGGSSWVEPRWERRSDGWEYIPGGWR